MENGLNDLIDFYVLDLDLRGNIDTISETLLIRLDGSYINVPVLAYNEDGNTEGIMTDLISGFKIYPKVTGFESDIIYKNKRKATLNEMQMVSRICNDAKKSIYAPAFEYIYSLKEIRNRSEEFSANYMEALESLSGYMTGTINEVISEYSRK